MMWAVVSVTRTKRRWLEAQSAFRDNLFWGNPTVNIRVYNRVDMAVPRVVTADDLRSQLGHELDQLRSSEEVLFVSKRGRLAAVLIDVEQYRAMVERSEYLEDSLAALQAREEVDLAIPWSKVRK